MKTRISSVVLFLIFAIAYPQNPLDEVSDLKGHVQNYKDKHTIIMKGTINDNTLTVQQQLLQYDTEMNKLKKDFTDKREAEYRALETMVKKTHSCTKGSSGGTKKCGTKCASAPSEAWYTKAEWTNTVRLEDNKLNATISPDGSAACLTLQKSGKGRMAHRIESIFKVREDWLLKQVQEDMHYVFTEVARLARGAVDVND